MPSQQHLTSASRPRTQAGRSANWVLALAAALGSVHAAEPHYLGLEAYGHEAGLSQLSVTSMVEDELGFLWIGTQDGLNRFDGHRFEVQRFRPDQPDGLLSSSVDLLVLDERERLWIGSNDAGLEVVDLRTRVRVRFGPSTLGHTQVLGIAPTDAGPIVIAMPNALLSISAELGAPQRIGEIPQLVALMADHSGRAVALDASCRLHLAEPTALTLLWDGSASGHMCMAFVPTRDGFWVADSAGELFELDLQGQPRAQVSVAEHLTPGAHISALEAAEDGALWVGLSSGQLLAVDLARADAAVQAVALAPAPNSAISLLHEDAAGVLWLGTYTDGLFRARSQAPVVRRELAPDPQRAGLKPSVRAFAQRADTRLIGFDGGLLKLVEATEPRAIAALQGVPVRAIAEGDDGGWWLGTQQGLRWLAADDSAHIIPGTEAWRITALRREPDQLLVATRAGLKRFSLPLMQPIPVPEALRDSFLTTLERDARGRLWIGSNENGVLVLDANEGVQRLGTESGLVHPSVWSLRADAAGMWVGSFSGGLHHFDLDGQLSTTFGERDGLSSSVIYGILPDARGRLWLSTNDGINLVAPASRRIQVLRPGDGLRNVEFNAGAAFLDPDMRLWFGGTEGVDVIEPWQREAKVPIARPVIAGLRLLGANGIDRSLQASAGIDIGRAERLQLKYGDTALVLQLAAIEPTAPASARLRYRLHGIDTDWIDLPRAQLELTYAHLPPGDYRLEVQAAGRGAEFGASRSLEIRVSPPPWQHPLAFVGYAVGVLVLLGLIALRVRGRIHRERRQIDLLNATVDQRTAELETANQMLVSSNARLEQANRIDPLTQVANRRELQLWLQDLAPQIQRELGERAGTGTGLTFFMIDIDDFKRVNDSLGHQSGDEVLVQFAQRLRELCRAQDRLVRWGGEEFLLAVRDLGTDGAAALAERIRQAIAHAPLTLRSGRLIDITCSIGYAPWPLTRAWLGLGDWEQSVNLADQALYRAKYDGKNSWVGLNVPPDVERTVLMRLLASTRLEDWPSEGLRVQRSLSRA